MWKYEFNFICRAAFVQSGRVKVNYFIEKRVSNFFKSLPKMQNHLTSLFTSSQENQ